jgi:hypothetical protein
VLHEDAAGAPHLARLPAPADERTGGQHKPGRYLLGTKKILMRGIAERPAMQGNNPLVALHIGSLIDGHRQMAAAEQPARRYLARPEVVHRSIETSVTAHAARCRIVGHEHVDRPVALGLQDELAFEFKG